MQQILLVTFPFFGLVLCGFVVGRARWLPTESIPGLNAFVLFFALPSMLYRFAANTPIVRLLDPGVCGVYLVVALLMVALTVAGTRRGAIGWNDAAYGALAAAFPNSGLPWAIALGCLTTATGLQLWEPARRTIDLLADGASPVALFTIGAVLARARQVVLAAGPESSRVADLPLLVALKLLVHPALVWAAGTLAQRIGVPLDDFALVVLVLVAALPSASNVPILAERFGADAARIARAVLLTTAGAFVSFSAAVSLLR